MEQEVIIVIPAYNPNEELIKLVKKLSLDSTVIVINDGSASNEIFDKIKNDCVVLEHSKNMGKGVALKTGFEFVLKNYNNVAGVVTADADGQHTIEDIKKVKEELINKKNNFVLGYRNFSEENVPFRNKLVILQ